MYVMQKKCARQGIGQTSRDEDKRSLWSKHRSRLEALR